MPALDTPVPEGGDVVRVTNTETDTVLVEGEVLETAVYDNVEDQAVYMEIDTDTTGVMIAFKIGEYEGEPYSWAMRVTDTMGDHDIDQNCWEYEVVE